MKRPSEAEVLAWIKGNRPVTREKFSARSLQAAYHNRNFQPGCDALVLFETSEKFTAFEEVTVQWRGGLEFGKPSRFLNYGFANLTFLLGASKCTNGDVHKFEIKAFPDAPAWQRINS